MRGRKEGGDEILAVRKPVSFEDREYQRYSYVNDINLHPSDRNTR